MSSPQQKRPKKSSPTYFSSILSISLILFVLGVIGTFFVQSSRLTQTLKENMAIQLVLQESVNESDRLQLSKQLEAEVFVKDVEVIDKEEAAALMKEDLGEDFLETIGYNPLPDAIVLHVNAVYSNPDSLAWITEKILSNQLVVAVNYDENLSKNITQFSSKVLVGMLIFLGLLVLISFIIIDNTIKLAMFSQRFIIRSMQLVGAKRWFITKPFVFRAIFNGVLSAVIASLALLVNMYLLEKYLIDLNIFSHYLDFLMVAGVLLLLGIVISLLSTFFAVRKYLRMKLDDLY
ncbi:permease-like cell division protein FtsX [Chitinophagales bacterium]|jgi:cell division transport system permease protein|nr:permease-like cell division protein FtsX [Chitinophagales bacterium]